MNFTNWDIHQVDEFDVNRLPILVVNHPDIGWLYLIGFPTGMLANEIEAEGDLFRRGFSYRIFGSWVHSREVGKLRIEPTIEESHFG
jgi:hypothetical protein